MNIAAYCRVSTDSADQLNSLEAQKQFFSQYTHKHGYNLVHLYADEGISGTKTKNRKQFLQLMNDAQKGLFEMVVVKDISRFARNTVDLLQNIRTLKALGIETTFLTANMTVLGQSEFVLTIFGALAQEESANISKRVKFGKKINARKGRVPNLVYGYNKEVGDYFNLQVNQHEAQIVQWIYHQYTQIGEGTYSISNQLNQRGLQTKRRCDWSANAVARILSNQLYTGVIINGKEEVADFLTGRRVEKEQEQWLIVERPELKIIEPEQFQKAQHILQERSRVFKSDKKRHSNKHLFSTLIYCRQCGCSFRRLVRTYKNTYIKWVCRGHNGKGADSCANAITLDEKDLLEQLKQYFCCVLQNEEDLDKQVVAYFRNFYRQQSGQDQMYQELSEQVEGIEKKRQKYVELYTDDLLSHREITEKLNKLRLEKEYLEAELAQIPSVCHLNDQFDKMVRQTFIKIDDITSLSQMTNAQLKSLVKRIEVDQTGKVDIYVKDLPKVVQDYNSYS
ncbi:MAG: recombinase family protein [Bacillota bacterium]